MKPIIAGNKRWILLKSVFFFFFWVTNVPDDWDIMGADTQGKLSASLSDRFPNK